MIHYPVEKGRMINVVGVLQDRDPTKEHSYERLVNPVSREKMYEDWKEWDPRLQRLLREFKTSDQWSLWDLVHDQKYFCGRVCLLGDAAHASVPHLGSGAGMAIEDAYILGNLIAGVRKVEDFKNAFTAYDAVRRPRTQELAGKSRESGQKHIFALPGVLDDLAALQAYSKEQYRWVWGLDLETSPWRPGTPPAKCGIRLHSDIQRILHSGLAWRQFPFQREAVIEQFDISSLVHCIGDRTGAETPFSPISVVPVKVDR